MAFPIKLILLLCMIEAIRAQYSNADIGVISNKRLPGRFTPRANINNNNGNNNRPAVGPSQSYQRIRRPLFKAKPVPSPLQENNELPVFNRPKLPGFTPALKPVENTPATPVVNQQQQQQHQQQQDQPIVKPVNEESEKDESNEENVSTLVQLSPNSFSPVANNLVSNPKSNDIVQQYRPTPVQYQEDIAPVQYRPQKPFKIRKLNDDVETRLPIKQKNININVNNKIKSDYRSKKPIAQVIKRWREDEPDGSITWGFENDDGSYKEEHIGIDCVTRGKYGYIDPEGLRREYTYETGIKCDQQQQQEQENDNGFFDYSENKLVLPSGKIIDLSNMGKKQSRRPQQYYKN